MMSSKVVCVYHPQAEQIDNNIDFICSEFCRILMTAYQSSPLDPDNCYSAEEAKVLYRQRDYLKDILELIHLNENILNDAMHYFKTVNLGKFRKKMIVQIKDNKFETLAMASLCASIRYNKCGICVEDIITRLKKPVATRCRQLFENICNAFNLKDQLKPDYFIERYCKSFGLPFEVELEHVQTSSGIQR